MQWKRPRIGGVFFCLLLTAGAGCRPAPDRVDLPETPYQGVTLHFACPDESTAALLRNHGQSWALRQGVTLHVERYNPTDPEQQRGKKAEMADVYLIPPAELPRWAAADLLAPLPAAYLSRDNPFTWSDLLPTFREQLLVWDVQAYGMPIVGESPVCCYRADLLAEPKHQAALTKLLGSSRDGPATWEQFAQLAEYFRDHGPEGKGGPSLPPLPKADADLERLFYTVAAGFARRAVRVNEERGASHQDDVFSFHYDLKTGEPRIATPGFVHALKWLQRLKSCRPFQSAEHPEEAFRTENAVLCLTDVPWLKRFQRTPALHDKVGICRVPGGECYYDFSSGQAVSEPKGNRVPYLGGTGWLAVVSRQSPHADAAFNLLADLAGPKTSIQIFLGADKRGGPLRTSQLSRNRWDAFDLDVKQEQRLTDTLEDALSHPNLKNPALCLRTPRQQAHRALLVEGLRKALEKDADAEATLRAVAEGWRKLDREQGLEEHKADYRRSLGLLAK